VFASSAPEDIKQDEEAVKVEVGGSSAVYKAAILACCGAFLFGYHLGVVNGPLQQIAQDLAFGENVALQGLVRHPTSTRVKDRVQCRSTRWNPWWRACVGGPLRPMAQEPNLILQVVSISLAGAAVGSLSGSVLADTLGRCKAFFADAIPLIAGAALCAQAESVSALLTGRFVIGVGIGLASALVPLYISEVAPSKIRGALGSWNQLMICLGILFALVVNVLLPATSWRTMFWISAIPAAILGGGRLCLFVLMTLVAFLSPLPLTGVHDSIPNALSAGMLFETESPLYLLSKGDKAAAESSASSLWGENYRSELYSATGGTGMTQELRGDQLLILRFAQSTTALSSVPS
jgi:MFS family permease